MNFRIQHRTVYHYSEPIRESVVELRLRPPDNGSQRVKDRFLRVQPGVKGDPFEDYFGNGVELLSIPDSHARLKVEVVSEVETFPMDSLAAYQDLRLGEALQILRGQRLDLYDYLLPTRRVPLGPVLGPLGRSRLPGSAPLIECLLEMNRWVYRSFRYRPGATEVSTPLEEVISRREGVCQDFAHLLCSLLRTSGLPARYVSGYIEAADPHHPRAEDLIGSAATHAWVEVGLPGQRWLGLDPTNNQLAGERHVVLAVGRDYADVAPVRGTFKGGVTQRLEVSVRMERIGNSARP